MDESLKVELTKQELATAIELFNIAVKAAGLEVANAALHLATKFSNVLKESQNAAN